MKRTLIVAASLFLALPALAQTTATGTGTANSSSSSGAVAIGGSGSATANGGSVTFNSPGSVSSRVRQSGRLATTPSAIAPGLGAAGVETCYGPGVSAGLSVTGFGAAFGMGQYDSSCNRRLNARTLWAFGAKRIALRIMANEPEVQQAMAEDGMITLQPGDVGYRGRPVAAGRRAVADNGGCVKWKNDVIGLQCLY
jgi:hypothetical protein